MHIQVESEIAEWLEASRRRCDMTVQQIPWRASREWHFDGSSLHHESGRFFRVVGARRPGLPDQPLIDQHEIGILGFLLRRINGRTEICVQAKPEPGNVNLVQIAPTVQATESNYQQVHHGLPTPLLKHFVSSNGNVVANSLQSEQGTRFLAKRNRNMVVESNAHAENDLLEWFDINDVLRLLDRDFIVNTDARSVFAVSPWEFLVDAPFARWENQEGFGNDLLQSYHSPGKLGDEEIEATLASFYNGETEVVGLTDLRSWIMSGEAIQRSDGTGFQVRQFDVTTTQREVEHWDQPLMALDKPGKAILLCRMHKGVLEFGFRPRHEIGFLDGAQYGPAIQNDEEVPPSTLLLSCKHSDEGGRFFQCVADYEIRQIETLHDEDVVWMTLGQVARLIQREGIFTNEARSLVSMLLTYL
ncbi:MAG: NDP-hexose 2,3-dehydratase family protein [Rubricoccaceae bacterium]|nr:NDP-hexose 2,3-dehydratase family protein [Rubricoccaceae bacterium]